MKENAVRFILGLALILGGLLFLAYNLEWIPQPSTSLLAIGFAVLSLVFFASFFLQGVKSWGLLIPACILAGLAIIIFLTNAGYEGSYLGTIIMLAIGIPFLVPLALSPRENWWAAIPSWTLIVIGLIILLAERVQGELVGALVLFAIALPFLFVYLVNRAHWWALIPAFVMGAIGAVVLLSTAASGELIGAIVLFAVGLPFFFVYTRRQENWWALIPAGILASVGIALLLLPLFGDNEARQTAWMNALIYLGIAITFGALWMRRATAPTDWARFPAIGFAAAALIAVAVGASSEIVLPIVLILVGLWMLTGFRTFRSAR